MKIKNVEIKGSAALAPMAGVADRSFREICKQFGAAYVVSEMVSSKGISYGNKKSAELMEISESEHPCAVQIFGDNPKTMAQAAEFALRFKPDIVDINMGCPAPKISGNGSGCALMKTPNLCGEIVKQVKSSVNIPVTVKIRKGWDDNSINAVEVAKICEQNGADAITIHGRTRMQYYAPFADWDIIAKVKKSVSIPVIGNGDVNSAESAKKMLETTNCDMVMVGRAALGKPWIFTQINEYIENGKLLPELSAWQKIDIMIKQIEKMCEHKEEKVAMQQARKHIAWYLKGFHGAAAFRNEAGKISSIEQLYSLTQRVLQSQL